MVKIHQVMPLTETSASNHSFSKLCFPACPGTSTSGVRTLFSHENELLHPLLARQVTQGSSEEVLLQGPMMGRQVTQPGLVRLLLDLQDF